MLSIILHTSVMGDAYEKTWHLGDQHFPILNVNNVVEIQADCDELDYIYNSFVGVPFSKQRVVRWYGDTAKFIVGNLKLITKTEPPTPQLEDEDYPEEVNHF